MGDTLSKDNWTVYIIKCGDGTYYTGISNDVSRRLEEHRSGKGAKYHQDFAVAKSNHGKSLYQMNK